MLHYSRTGETIVIPDGICTHSDLDLAHHQMQLHLPCRIDHCAWKWVAYTTLIHHGRIVPSETSPHERALHRGLWAPDTAASQPFRQILDGLERLARDLRDPGRTEP